MRSIQVCGAEASDSRMCELPLEESSARRAHSRRSGVGRAAARTFGHRPPLNGRLARGDNKPRDRAFASGLRLHVSDRGAPNRGKICDGGHAPVAHHCRARIERDRSSLRFTLGPSKWCALSADSPAQVLVPIIGQRPKPIERTSRFLRDRREAARVNLALSVIVGRGDKPRAGTRAQTLNRRDR